jgi:predicted ATPase
MDGKKSLIYVLTGGPCCGKTTVAEELRNRGYNVLEEVARQVLSEKTKQKINDDYESIQTEIFQRQIKQENEYRGLVFLDRSVIDCFAYSQLRLGYIPPIFLETPREEIVGRYETVFLLEPLPFAHDGLRIEKDEEEAMKVHDMIVREYQNWGYDMVHIPVIRNSGISDAVRMRADFIVNYVREK